MSTQLDEEKSEPKLGTTGIDREAPTTAGSQRAEVEIVGDNAATCYANFCRVTGTPEERILDFGLNAEPFGTAPKIDVKQRLVVNYYTAKRLLKALGMSIQRHETTFGVLETDIQKRVSPNPMARRASSGG